MQRLVFTDGGNTKAINPWDVDGNPEAWTWYSGQPRRVQDEYYSKVAAMYRAINLKANTVSSIPFALLDSNGEEYDSSKQWENKVGFLPNPQELFRLNVLSYMASNTIYNVKTSDAVGYKTRGLYHALPQSFTPMLNGSQTSVDFIERVVGTKAERYQYPKDKNLIRMWRLDHTTELLPSAHTESQAIASAAEIILYADFWVGNFFRRGGIKPTLIAMKGLIDSDKREEKERSWSNWLKGIGKQFGNIARIYNAETMDAKTIGAGVEDMKDNNIYRQAIENIAMGTGMPLSLLLANSANMATAQEEKATWYESDIIPFVNWMAYEYNTQLFQPLGLFLEFRPETVDANQEDETSRASAVNTFMDFLNKCPTYEVFIGTAETFGYELSESLINAADKYYKEKKEAAAVVANNMQPTQPTQKPAPMEDEPVDQEEPEEDKPVKWIPSLDELEEMRVWREVALRRHKKGEGLDFEYLPHHSGLPESVSKSIKAKLLQAGTADDIKAAFVIEAEKKPASDIQALAEAMNRMAEAYVKSGA